MVPGGGGGLISGVGRGEGRASATAMWGVEPERFDDTRLSLEAGRGGRRPGRRSLCDAISKRRSRRLTFPLYGRNLAGIVAVGDGRGRQAMRAAFEALKLVVEPGGAAGLAALLGGGIEARGRTVVVVLSGGNVDPLLFARVLEGGI